jgi:excisionase family DNA binding protein
MPKQTINEVEGLLTVEELAHRLKVKKSWVYAQTRLKNIPFLKCGKYCRFQWEKVIKSMQEA